MTLNGARHTSLVTSDDIRPLTAEVDPTAPGYGNHLSFDAILRRCGLAWTHFLHGLEGFGDGVIVPRLTVDYSAEVHEGELAIDVEVVRIGTSSFTLRCTVWQDERQAAAVDVVLVSYGYDDQRALPLTVAQRRQLEERLSGAE